MIGRCPVQSKLSCQYSFTVNAANVIIRNTLYFQKRGVELFAVTSSTVNQF